MISIEMYINISCNCKLLNKFHKKHFMYILNDSIAKIQDVEYLNIVNNTRLCESHIFSIFFINTFINILFYVEQQKI